MDLFFFWLQEELLAPCIFRHFPMDGWFHSERRIKKETKIVCKRKERLELQMVDKKATNHILVGHFCCCWFPTKNEKRKKEKKKLLVVGIESDIANPADRVATWNNSSDSQPIENKKPIQRHKWRHRQKKEEEGCEDRKNARKQTAEKKKKKSLIWIKQERQLKQHKIKCPKKKRKLGK